MPLRFQGLAYMNPLIVESVDSSQVVEALNLSKRGIRRPGQYWRMTLTLEPEFQAAQGSNAFARLAAHKAEMGKDKTFPVPMPQLTGTGHVLDGVSPPVVDRNAAEDTDFRVHTPFAQMHEAIGRFVKFAGRDKIYMIQNVSAVSGQSGRTDIRTFPLITPDDFPLGQPIILMYHTFNMTARYQPTGRFSVQVNGQGILQETIVVEEAL